jgi:hypothetical protein
MTSWDSPIALERHGKESIPASKDGAKRDADKVALMHDLFTKHG